MKALDFIRYTSMHLFLYFIDDFDFQNISHHLNISSVKRETWDELKSFTGSLSFLVVLS